MNSFSNFNLSIPELWEVRDVYNKVKSRVLNYTEMEAKVHEATNNEAWGASSTAMQEIAQATFDYQYFNEIMPTIYKRFTDKEAKYWRQIYKSLVLLEYLVKNGSERVVDDARSHISMIKMMKNFYYVDEKGKDQGINVRNRAKELADLLGDVDMIKAERKKAKKNRNKYTGVGSDGSTMFSSGGGSGMGMGSGSYFSTGSRYEGFGSDSVGHQDSYDTDFYDEGKPGRYDDDNSPSPTFSDEKEVEPSQPKKTAKDLFDFDDGSVSTNSNVNKKATQDEDWGDFADGGNDDDEFDDFQSAPVMTTKTTPPPKPAHSAPKKTNDIFDLLGDDTVVSSTSNNNDGLLLTQGISFEKLSIQSPVTTSGSSTPVQQQPSQPVTSSSKQTDNTPLNSLWSSGSNLFSLDSLGGKSSPSKPAQGPSMNALKNSNLNKDWNNWASTNQQQHQPSTNNNNDLLF